MYKSEFRKTFLSLITIYLILVALFFAISNKFFIDDFISLEKKHNKININSFLNLLENDITSLNQITKDYALWDDTYNFIQNKNDEYIYDNFRENSNTLEGLKIDSFIFVNSLNKVMFSTYNLNTKLSNINKKQFEENLIRKLNDASELSSILYFEDKFFFVVKTKIARNDLTGDDVGYIISLKYLEKEYFKNKANGIFTNISSETTQLSNNLETSTFPNINRVEYSIKINNKDVNSFINFYDYKDNYVKTFILTNDSSIVYSGKNTITIFNIISAGILFFVFFVIYQKEKLIIQQNDELNRKVEKSTEKLKEAYKKLKKNNDELYKLAHTDSLTGISNRADFFSASVELLNKSKQNNKLFTILMIDIDYFKKVNDQYGHSVGDKVLIKFSNLVQSQLEEKMIFGRLGGEEFAISIYDKDEEYIATLSEKIRKKVESLVIKNKDNEIRFTISIGLAFKNNSNENIDEILNRADELLYKAKSDGRNRVVRSNSLRN